VRLQAITDMGGIVSSFSYAQNARNEDESSTSAPPDNGFLNALTTPYGTTNFTSWRWVPGVTSAGYAFARATEALLPPHVPGATRERERI
jgi:hypothetical protein